MRPMLFLVPANQASSWRTVGRSVWYGFHFVAGSFEPARRGKTENPASRYETASASVSTASSIGKVIARECFYGHGIRVWHQNRVGSRPLSSSCGGSGLPESASMTQLEKQTRSTSL